MTNDHKPAIIIAVGGGKGGVGKSILSIALGTVLARSGSSVVLALVFFGIGLVVGGIGLTGTRAALPFYWAWMAIAFALGGIMSRVLFGLFFYGLLTPLALLMRLTGRDRLHLRRCVTDSHWHNVPAVRDLARYERQS
jgi:hypothetical protein